MKTLTIGTVLLCLAIGFIGGSAVTVYLCDRKVEAEIRRIDQEMTAAAASWRARTEACESLLKGRYDWGNSEIQPTPSNSNNPKWPSAECTKLALHNGIVPPECCFDPIHEHWDPKARLCVPNDGVIWHGGKQ